MGRDIERLERWKARGKRCVCPFWASEHVPGIGKLRLKPPPVEERADTGEQQQDLFPEGLDSLPWLE